MAESPSSRFGLSGWIYPILVYTGFVVLFVLFMPKENWWMIGIWAPILYFRFRYIQKQKSAGNLQPYKRLVLASKALLITLPVLAVIHYLLKVLHILPY